MLKRALTKIENQKLFAKDNKTKDLGFFESTRSRLGNST